MSAASNVSNIMTVARSRRKLAGRSIMGAVVFMIGCPGLDSGGVAARESAHEDLQEVFEKLVIAADPGPLRVVAAGLEPLQTGHHEDRDHVGGVDVVAEQAAVLALTDAFGTQPNQFGIHLAAALVAFDMRPGQQAHHLWVVL